MEDIRHHISQRKETPLTFFRSASIRGLPLLHMTDVPLKSNSIFAISSSISSLSRSAITTTIPPPKLSLAMASWFSNEPWANGSKDQNMRTLKRQSILQEYKHKKFTNLSLHPRIKVWFCSTTSLFPFLSESNFSEMASETSPSIIANTSIPPKLMESATSLGPIPSEFAWLPESAT